MDEVVISFVFLCGRILREERHGLDKSGAEGGRRRGWRTLC